METTVPHKGQGVPRQTQERNHIDALALALDAVRPGSGDDVRARLVAAGFFDAGMIEQVRMMARAAVEVLPDADALIDALIEAQSTSADDNLSGVAALVPRLTTDDVDAQLAALRRVGAVPSTWARELAQSELHHLCIEHGVDAILARAGHWVRDADDAVRRVLVEGLRPRGVMLPHIDELKRDPTPLWPVIEQVLDDPSDYVRKAAANLLNDVSRDHRDLLLDRVAAWTEGPMGPERTFIVERALRTLVKQRDAEALALLGYAPASSLDARLTETPPATLVMNGHMPFAVHVANTSARSARVVVRVDVTEPGAGDRTRTSSYLIAKSEVPAGQEATLRKRIHFVDRNRQPKLDGTYVFAVTVNGDEIGTAQATFRRG